MKQLIKRKKEFIKSEWGGGSTTELFIFPYASSYAGRDFELRISSATVECSPSEFTRLNGYHRLLMPLNAPLRLIFNGQNEVSLNPFEVAEFDGGASTVSHGVCTDVGIMLCDKWRGSLFAASGGEFNCKNELTFVYALAGGVQIRAKKDCILNSGDLLILEGAGAIFLQLPSKNSAIILTAAKNE